MERWGSRLGALLALVGGAVGLGNFLRFPFQAAKWGGGAFLVPYFIALIGVGLPLVWMEMGLGRAAAGSGARSAPDLLATLLGKPGRLIGLLGVFVSLSVGAYYAYLTGWTLGYTYHALIGSFSILPLEKVVAFHREFLRQEGLLFYGLTWLLVGLILRRGLQAGLEKVNLWGMPILFLLATGIAIGAVWIGDTGRCATCDSHLGIGYLYQPRWEALGNPAVWLAATGQVFFSIGVGFAMYPVYAAYAEQSSPLREGTQTVLANTLAEVGLGGLIVIPLVTAFLGLEYVQAQAGFGMGFAVMPYVLQQWGGRFLVAAWYLLLFLAAISSLLAMGWVGLTWLSSVGGGSPTRWSWVLAGGMALLGLPAVLGYERGALELYDLIAGTLGLIVAAFGHWWAFLRTQAWETLKPGGVPKAWRFFLVGLPPIFLGLLLIGSFFQPENGDWIGAFSHLFTRGEWPLSNEALPHQLLRSLIASKWNMLGGLLLLLLAGMLLALRRRE